MTPKGIKHRKLDLDLNNTDIVRILRKKFKTELTQQYVGMILRGQRTGYRHRKYIAKILKLRIRDLPAVPKLGKRAVSWVKVHPRMVDRYGRQNLGR